MRKLVQQVSCYPVTLLFITRCSITASFVKTVINFPATNIRQNRVYLYGFLERSACFRVNNKPLVLMSHMDNVDNQCIIRLCTNYCYCINSVAISVLLLFCTDTDIGKNYHISGQCFSRSDYRYTSTMVINEFHHAEVDDQKYVLVIILL